MSDVETARQISERAARIAERAAALSIIAALTAMRRPKRRSLGQRLWDML